MDVGGGAIAGTFVAYGIGVYFVITWGVGRILIVDQLLVPVFTAAYAIVGGLVASRHPRNPIGWIFLAVAWNETIALTLRVYERYGPVMGASGSVPEIGQNLWVFTTIFTTIFVFLLFPNGRLISSRWRIVLWSAALGLVVQHVALALHPGPLLQWGVEDINPDGIPVLADTLDVVLEITRILLVIGMVGSIAAFVIRVRRSRGIERQQMKWLSYAIGLTLLSFAFGSLTWSLRPGTLATEISDKLTYLAILGIAVATGIAILRYRLWDIDIVINRTLVYTALTVSVLLIYVLIVGGLGALVRAESSVLIALLATGLIAVLFQPLRARLQRAINQLTYGDRDDPFEALARLGRRLEGNFSPELVYPTIVETAAQALKLPYVAIAVKHGDGFETVEDYGTNKGDPVAYQLRHQGEVIGQLLVGRRSPGENFSAADERLLRNFARQAGTAVHAVQLTADLQLSRQQLVTAREEERLRLRRDLHDGLGPALASVVWQADSARDMIYTDPPEAAQLLEGSIKQAQDALADIRRLVYGLRPPALDELGLVGALEQAAHQHQQTSVAIEAPAPLPSLPAAVEVAAYRIVREALKNAMVHGKAQHCDVRLALDGNLCLTVGDDGQGLSRSATPGVGLVSMRERAEELGGAFTIHPRPGGGTEVEVSLPLD